MCNTIDLTDIIESGYCEKDTGHTLQSQNLITYDYPNNSKIIIFCEGKFDKFVLSESLTLLFPQYFHLYSFIDFEISKLEGGAPRLISYAKSFISSGIKNRIIFIFDNDTAGIDAIQEVKKLSLPDNIIITKYPDLPFFENYPTIGPNGNSILNINGTACSIELYLGKNILMENNRLIPIQWKGYNERVKKYHGEILYKSMVQEKFLKILKDNKRTYNKIDWGFIKKIWEHIFSL